MTLEDFFTLTELKDGLTSPDRVKELITAMQKEKDRVVKNVGDASRQWSTVANIIAVTESKDCLDLFVQSDGLWFLNRWLNDAQKFGHDSGNIFVEESISALLGALDRLQIDNRTLASSGIVTTVLDLLGHGNSLVHDKAKAFCDRWMQPDTKAPHDDGTNPSVAISPSRGNDNEEKIAEQSRDDMKPLVCFDTVQQADKEDKTTADKTDPATTKLEPLVPGDPPGISRLDECAVDAKEKHKIDTLDKAGEMEMSNFAGPLEQGALPSRANINNVLESAMKADLREDIADNDLVDSGADALQDSPGDNCERKVAEYPKIDLNTESDSGADDAKKHVGAQSEDDSGTGSRFSKPSIKAQGGGVTSKGSNMKLDYGMVDPLEVVRQVAMEVEREVDSRERSCSTSDKMSGGGIERPKSPDSTNGKGSQPIGGLTKLVSSGPGPGPGPSLKAMRGGALHVNDAETLGSDHKHDIAASQVSEVAQESEANTERGFDLNQEVCSEEINHPMNLAVVSASRVVGADISPAAPLQFEGNLGWKGSAVTSAFRRIPECSFSGTPSNSKQRSDCLNIDLNVAEDSTGLPSGEESSIEASPRRTVRLHLDLNSLGDGSVDNVVPDWRRDGRVASLNQNGCQSPSQSSSSSSMQPSMRNMDLNFNDQSIFPNGSFLNHHNLGNLFNNSTASRGMQNREESVISLMGTQIEVKHEDVVPQPNGRILEPLGRSNAGWGLGSSMAVYGHHGFPSMYLSSPYGPLGAPSQYMVDPRGVPQLVLPPPFIMNMAAGTSNGAGASQHNLELNPGFMINGGSSRESDNQSRANEWVQASSSSVVGGKRQEPDGGWDVFQPPPWK